MKIQSKRGTKTSLTNEPSSPVNQFDGNKRPSKKKLR